MLVCLHTCPVLLLLLRTSFWILITLAHLSFISVKVQRCFACQWLAPTSNASVGIIREISHKTVCQLATSFLAKEMQTNKSEAFIEKELENVCNLMPSSIASLCDSIVEQQGPAIIAKIAGEVQADVCTAIHMCQAKRIKSNGLQCESSFRWVCLIVLVCEAVVGEVQQMLETNQNISLKIEQVLEDDVCTRLPQSIQAIVSSRFASLMF